MELPGAITAVDKIAGTGNASSDTVWSSGATATTTQAVDFVAGIGVGVSTNIISIIGPSSPWNNLTAENEYPGGGTYYPAIAGYQFVSALAAYTYSGTFSVASNDGMAACVAAFKFTPGGGGGGGVSPGSFMPFFGAR